MFLVFIEYIYSICYYFLNKSSNSNLSGTLLLLKNKVFSPHIMFFMGLVSLIGIVLAFFGIIFRRKLIKVIALVLHMIFFYFYMNNFLGMPVTKVFSFLKTLLGYIKMWTK